MRLVLTSRRRIGSRRPHRLRIPRSRWRELLAIRLRGSAGGRNWICGGPDGRGRGRNSGFGAGWLLRERRRLPRDFCRGGQEYFVVGCKTELRPGQGAAVSTLFFILLSLSLHTHMARTVDYQRLEIFLGTYLHVFPPSRTIYNASYPRTDALPFEG